MAQKSNKEPKTGTRRALSFVFGQQFVTLIFSFGSTIILSRLLTPKEIGIFSVAAGLLALVNMLRDFGVSEFLVQETVLDKAMVRTVFTMNLAIAWCLGSLVFASSHAIGEFYADPAVGRVLKVMSIPFFLLPFGTTTNALLKREMEFGKLALINTVGSIARSLTKVSLAYAGFSYMSLAWGSIAGIFLTVVGFIVWGWKYRVTGLSFVHWRRVLHFGSNRTISDVAAQLGSESPNLIIGKMLGMDGAGLYSRGYGLVSMFRSNFIGAIQTVAFPAFAREHREYAKAPQLFLKALVYVTGISWPFFACGVILAYPIINIMFGDQWNAAVPLTRWLCGAAMIGTLIYQCNGFLVALGRVRTVTRVEVQYQLARVGITVAAAFYSLEAVAAVQVLVYLIAVVLYYRQMRVYEALAMRTVIRALVPSALVTLATCIVPIAVVLTPHFLARHMVAAFAVAVIGGCGAWMLAIVFARHPLRDELKRVISRVPGSHRLLRG